MTKTKWSQLGFATMWLGVALFTAAHAPRTATADDVKSLAMPLWSGPAPGALGKLDGDVPSITVYQPTGTNASDAAVVVCPGGGYGGLAMDHEGKQIADWLNAHGITAVVLKYRLGPRYHHPVELGDAQRAIRTVRAHASEWRLNPKHVAILGFSAGGHLASTAGTHFDDGDPNASDAVDRESCRPDAMILVYPVIAIATPYAHLGSKRNLLGDNPPRELVESLSNETQVTARTPPTFLVHSDADAGVPAENSLLFAMALRKAKVPMELHLYEPGPHGFGLGKNDPALHTWPDLCITFLKRHGFGK